MEERSSEGTTHDRIFYARATCGEEEKAAVQEVLETPEMLVGGEKTDDFQAAVAEQFGKTHGVMVNSGSSANLLAVECLDLPPGTEVITPALTFSTTVAPLVQNDLIPVFVDSTIGDYQIDVNQVEAAITDQTGALMIPSIIGNVPDLPRLRNLADEYDLYLIEDSADTLGATIDDKPTGTYSDISTTSFYGSHIITGFGGGGMVCVDNKDLLDQIRKLRGWGRRSAVDESESIDERLSADLDGITYDHKFIFDEFGYNFHPLEASAAYGLEQIKKLETFSDLRRRNFDWLREFFNEYDEMFILPEQRDEVETSWMAYPVTVRTDAPFERNELVKHLESNGIQTRSLWSGNITRHPAVDDIEYRIASDGLPNADFVMEHSFVIACHQSIGESELHYIRDTVTEFLRTR